jgi:hypothetical protein
MIETFSVRRELSGKGTLHATNQSAEVETFSVHREFRALTAIGAIYSRDERSLDQAL